MFRVDTADAKFFVTFQKVFKGYFNKRINAEGGMLFCLEISNEKTSLKWSNCLEKKNNVELS